VAGNGKCATCDCRLTSINFGADRHECPTIVAQFVPFTQRAREAIDEDRAGPAVGNVIGAS
jgi:hypothetical protein